MSPIGRQCVILVGGLGTRLGTFTANCPKPLLDVAGAPFVSHLMDNARRFGFDKFVLLAGYKSELVRDFADRYRSDRNVEVAVCEESEPAGTAGALLGAKPLLDSEFLLLNGDSIFDFNLLDLAGRSIDQPWLARIALRRVPDTSRYGRAELSGTKISALREKSTDRSEGLINGGVYWLRSSILEMIDRIPKSLEQDLFPKLASEGLLHGFEYAGPFIDIGVPDDLARARSGWRYFLCRPAIFFDRDGVLNEDGGYTHKRDEFRWIPGAKEAIKRANDSGQFVFVVTNQAGIARGYYDEAAVESLHSWMNDDLRSFGAHIDDFRLCPHHPDGRIPELSITCNCRKPQPGMITSLMKQWPVDRTSSVLIGDKQSDLEAAAAAGIRGLDFNQTGFDLHD